MGSDRRDGETKRTRDEVQGGPSGSQGSGGEIPPCLNADTPPPLIACGAPTPEEHLPHALTFFLSAGQRRAVLEVLRMHHARRANALLRALGITHD